MHRYESNANAIAKSSYSIDLSVRSAKFGNRAHTYKLRLNIYTYHNLLFLKEHRKRSIRPPPNETTAPLKTMTSMQDTTTTTTMEAKISTLLTEMNVSKSSTEMLATYRGREDQLLEHLRKMKAKMDENAAVATMAAGAVDDRNDAATVATSDSTSNGTANDDDAMNAEIESLLLELDIPKRSREGMLSAYKGREDEIGRHLRTMKARKDNRAAAAKMTTPMAADDTTSDAMSTKETCASSPSFILADNINGGRGHANRRVFITGGSGLVGHQCAETFRAAGWKVVATHCSFPTPVTVRYDCTQPQCPENFDVESFRPHLIIHCAAATHVDQCERDRDIVLPVQCQSSEAYCLNCQEMCSRFGVH